MADQRRPIGPLPDNLVLVDIEGPQHASLLGPAEMLGGDAGEELASVVRQVRYVGVPHAELVGWDIHVRGLRVEGLRLPAGPAEQRGTDFHGRATHRRTEPGILHALAGSGIRAAPVKRLDERHRREKLPGDPIERVDVAELVGLDDRLVSLSVADHVDDVLLGHCVEVPGLVGQVLVVPLQLSGIEIEGDCGHRVAVVAPTHVGDPRCGVAGAEVEEIGGGIVGAGVPDGAAADLPRVGGPRLATRLAGGRDRIPAP